MFQIKMHVLSYLSLSVTTIMFITVCDKFNCTDIILTICEPKLVPTSVLYYIKCSSLDFWGALKTKNKQDNGYVSKLGLELS